MLDLILPAPKCKRYEIMFKWTTKGGYDLKNMPLESDFLPHLALQISIKSLKNTLELAQKTSF